MMSDSTTTSRRRSNWWRWGLVVLLVAGGVVLEIRLAGTELLDMDGLAEQLEVAGPLAPLLFMLVMALAVVISPIPSLPLDVLAGTAFGPIEGAVYALLGATLGAGTSFMIARALGRELMSRLLKSHVDFCRECSDKLLSKVVFLSRLLPFVSFDLVSYGAGLTRMSLRSFLLATFFGMIPLTLLYTTFGSAALASRLARWVGGLVMVSLLFLLPRWIERYDLFSMRRLLEHDKGDEEDGE